jgi:hypothetical protein
LERNPHEEIETPVGSTLRDVKNETPRLQGPELDAKRLTPSDFEKMRSDSQIKLQTLRSSLSGSKQSLPESIRP